MSRGAGVDKRLRRNYGKAMRRIAATDPEARDAIEAYVTHLVDRIIALKNPSRP